VLPDALVLAAHAAQQPARVAEQRRRDPLSDGLVAGADGVAERDAGRNRGDDPVRAREQDLHDLELVEPAERGDDVRPLVMRDEELDARQRRPRVAVARRGHGADVDVRRCQRADRLEGVGGHRGEHRRHASSGSAR
jgi:hypothetical protein